MTPFLFAMKPKCLLPWLFYFLLVGCYSNGFSAILPKMEIEIINKSSHDLQNALVRFGNYDCEWGYVGKTFSKSYLSYPHPITAHAELHWDEDGKHRVEKLDLSQVYVRGKSGRLAFSVRDGGVEASFREAALVK